MPGPLCSVCAQQSATYVCQNCGRPACGNCFDTTTWTCQTCKARATPRAQSVSYGPTLHFGIANILLFLAFAAIFIGMLLIALGSMSNTGNVSSGAVILIGPIPIILGNGPYSFELIELAVVLTIVAIVLFLVVRRHA